MISRIVSGASLARAGMSTAVQKLGSTIFLPAIRAAVIFSRGSFSMRMRTARRGYTSVFAGKRERERERERKREKERERKKERDRKRGGSVRKRKPPRRRPKKKKEPRGRDLPLCIALSKRRCMYGLKKKVPQREGEHRQRTQVSAGDGVVTQHFHQDACGNSRRE